MTNEEKIKTQYRLLGLAINWRGPDKHRRRCVRRHLDRIKDLMLEPEPGTLASSVIRLTYEEHIKQFEKKNYELNLKLSQYQAGWCPYDCATREELAELRAEIKQLKQEISKLKRHCDTAKVLLDNKNQYIKTLNRDFDTVTLSHAELMEEIVKQIKYIELLKKDRSQARMQGSAPSDAFNALQRKIRTLEAENAELRKMLAVTESLLNVAEGNLTSREACLRRNQRTLEMAREVLQQ